MTDGEVGPDRDVKEADPSSEISPWQIALYRAFGNTEPVNEIYRRSFNQGTVRLPCDTDETWARRNDLHRLFDKAEEYVLKLLASGQLKAEGAPPQTDRDGQRRNKAARQRVEIPAVTFSDRNLAFGPHGELESRVDVLGSLGLDHEVSGTADDTSIPLFFDVRCLLAVARKLVKPAGLRGDDSATEVQPPAPPPKTAAKTGRKSHGPKMRQALSHLLRERGQFDSQKAAWRATLTLLNVKEDQPGFSSQAFADNCGDLLRAELPFPVPENRKPEN